MSLKYVDSYYHLIDTHHLEGCEVFLPPDILLILRTHGSHHVVKVHYDVNERVEQSEESAVTTCHKINTYILLSLKWKSLRSIRLECGCILELGIDPWLDTTSDQDNDPAGNKWRPAQTYNTSYYQLLDNFINWAVTIFIIRCYSFIVDIVCEHRHSHSFWYEYIKCLII